MFRDSLDPTCMQLLLEICPGENTRRELLTDSEVAASVTLSFDDQKRSAAVTLLPEWQWALYRPDNQAEIVLATKLLLGFAHLQNVNLSGADAENLVRTTVSSIDVRWRHAFDAVGTADRLAASNLIKPFREIPESAGALEKCGSGWRIRDRTNGQKIHGKEDCTAFLTEHAHDFLETLRRRIQQHNKQSLVVAALESLQSAIKMQASWRSATRALRAIHGIERDAEISMKSMNGGNAVIRGASIAIEIAIAESPESGGLETGAMDIEEIEALCLLYFHTVDTLAAMHGDRVDPVLSISPTGEVRFDVSFEQQALAPSAERRHIREREDASKEYISRFQPAVDPGQPTQELLDAVRAEYGIDWGTLVDFSQATVQIAEEENAGVFVQRRQEFLSRIQTTKHMRGENLNPLLERWMLPCRKGWNIRLPGQNDTDFDLAKFDRRFSLIGRPIIALSESDDPPLAIAPAVIERALRHNLAGAYSGALQNQFWISKEMRTYASRQGERAGLEFNIFVADEIRKLGLRAWPSAGLSWCLNRKATDALKMLGDIDVLAVTPDGSLIWIIEAKDLKLCRTSGEAARRLSGYRGRLSKSGKPDNLLRHLRRVDYIRSNSSALCGRLQLREPPKQVCGVVIVRAPQPMEQFQIDGTDGRVVMLSDISQIPWAQGW